MNTQELAQAYNQIGARLQAGGHHNVGVDYCYVANLIQKSRDMPLLIGELRRNLNRSRHYAGCEKRNKTLHVMAAALERLHNPADLDWRHYAGGE